MISLRIQVKLNVDGFMYDFIENVSHYIIVSFGAIAGALFRIKIINLLALNRVSNIQSILTINTISNFLLGIFIGLNNEPRQSLYLSLIHI